MENLGEILRRLHAAEVEFVLIGGLAAVHHGTSYATYDVDICVPLQLVNFRRIEKAVKDLNPRFRQRKDMPLNLTDDEILRLQNLYLLTDLGPLDCLGYVANIGDYSAALEQSKEGVFPFGKIRVLKIDSLIRAKEAIGRPQDLFVITQLRAIQERQGT
jgi:hypothetical protein